MMIPVISDWLFRPGLLNFQLFKPLSDLAGASDDLSLWPFRLTWGTSMWVLHLPMWLLLPIGLSCACAIDGIATEATTNTDATSAALRMFPPSPLAADRTGRATSHLSPGRAQSGVHGVGLTRTRRGFCPGL